MPDQVYDMLSHPPKRFGSVERTCCVASRGKLAPMGKAIRTHKANPSNPRLARTRTSHQNFVEYQDFLNRMYVVGLLTKSTTKAMVKRKIEEREAMEDWTRCARGLVDTGGGKSGRDKIVADDKDKGDSTDKQHSSEVIPLSSYGDGTPIYYAPDREITVSISAYYSIRVAVNLYDNEKNVKAKVRAKAGASQIPLPQRLDLLAAANGLFMDNRLLDSKMLVVVNAQTIINAAGAKDSDKSVWNVVDYNMMKK